MSTFLLIQNANTKVQTEVQSSNGDPAVRCNDCRLFIAFDRAEFGDVLDDSSVLDADRKGKTHVTSCATIRVSSQAGVADGSPSRAAKRLHAPAVP